MRKKLHFISGLPRSGTTLITNILKQNPSIHGEAVSSLASILGSVHASWAEMEPNKEYINMDAKKGVLKSILQGYYEHIDRPIVFDKDRAWISQINLLENLFEEKVKILICVRNPAEILSSFERIRKENPLFFTRTDSHLRESSNIATRAYYYAGPDGPLGSSHRNLKDAITMGYLDRFLFIDYNRFCNTPKSQLKRIYDFFELPEFTHDLENIKQTEVYNYLPLGLPDLHTIKPVIDRTVYNCVEYLGLDLYEQYNREIFWNAWI